MNDDKDMHDGLVTSCEFVRFLYLIMNAVSLYVCKKCISPTNCKHFIRISTNFYRNIKSVIVPC